MKSSTKTTSIESSDVIAEALEYLMKIREISLENIKDSCVQELQRFIDARGSIDENGESHLFFGTVAEQNAPARKRDMKFVNELIPKIKTANSAESIRSELDNIRKTQSPINDDLNATLVKCEDMLNILFNYTNNKTEATSMSAKK